MCAPEGRRPRSRRGWMHAGQRGPAQESAVDAPQTPSDDEHSMSDILIPNLPPIRSLNELLVDHKHDGEHVVNGLAAGEIGPEKALEILAELEGANLQLRVSCEHETCIVYAQIWH